MTDDLEVRIERLKTASGQWAADAEALRAPLRSDWKPSDLTTSPAMPGGLKELIDLVNEATTQLRTSLSMGASSCEAAAKAIGKAAGLYQEQEDDAAQRSRIGEDQPV